VVQPATGAPAGGSDKGDAEKGLSSEAPQRAPRDAQGSEDRGARRRPVRVEGLSPGTSVVVNPPAGLADGTLVAPAKR